jgi:hypothetical protein
MDKKEITQQEALEMLQKIDNIVQTEFCFDVVYKHAFDRPFTQEEAEIMAGMLGDIYSISHTIHCTAQRAGNNMKNPIIEHAIEEYDKIFLKIFLASTKHQAFTLEVWNEEIAPLFREIRKLITG